MKALVVLVMTVAAVAVSPGLAAAQGVYAAVRGGPGFTPTRGWERSATRTPWTSRPDSKNLQLLEEAKPSIVRVAAIVDPTNQGQAQVQLAASAEEASRALGLTRRLIPVTTGGDLVAAFPAILKERADALLVCR